MGRVRLTLRRRLAQELVELADFIKENVEDGVLVADDHKYLKEITARRNRIRNLEKLVYGKKLPNKEK